MYIHTPSYSLQARLSGCDLGGCLYKDTITTQQTLCIVYTAAIQTVCKLYVHCSYMIQISIRKSCDLQLITIYGSRIIMASMYMYMYAHVIQYNTR